MVLMDNIHFAPVMMNEARGKPPIPTAKWILALGMATKGKPNTLESVTASCSVWCFFAQSLSALSFLGWVYPRSQTLTYAGNLAQVARRHCLSDAKAAIGSSCCHRAAFLEDLCLST